MSKRNIVFMAMLIAVTAILVGCGGGGGKVDPEGGGGTQQPPVDATRKITGTVVSSKDGAGVAGVSVRFGTVAVATSAGDGRFTINVSANASLPVRFQVDTGLVADVYPTSSVVKYKNQYYYPTAIDVPIEVLNGESNLLGDITVYDYSGDEAPPPPYASKNTVIMGRVVNGATGLGVAGVVIRLGVTPDPVFTTNTGKGGYFAIDLGFETSLLSLYPSTFVKFGATLGAAESLFPATAVINYKSINYIPGAVMPVGPEVVAGESNDLGVLKILSTGTPGGGGGDNGGGDLPPPPPIYQ